MTKLFTKTYKKLFMVFYSLLFYNINFTETNLRFIEEPRSFYTTYDDSGVKLVCKAEGRPPPKIYWTINQRNITTCEFKDLLF